MATDLIIIQRSAIVALEKCPRKRWYEYEIYGRGLSSVKRHLALETGGAVHAGLQELLEGKDANQAVMLALMDFDRMVDASGVDLTLYEGQNPRRVVDEHRAMVEVLIRAFAASELEGLLREYEVVAVEREVSRDWMVSGTTVRLLARVDGLLRRRSDQGLYILNFKTASQLGSKWRGEWSHDQQVISEMLAAEPTFGPISGVLIYGLAKGSRLEYPQGSGNWYHNSPLLHGWRMQGEPPMVAEDWKGRYETAEGKRLGRGYRKVSVWDNYPGGIKGWLANLMRTDPALVREQFVLLPPIRPTVEDVQEWQNSVIEREMWVQSRAKLIPLVEGDQAQASALSANFPRHTSGGNCVWPGRCGCYELCFGAAAADPVGSGLYQLRSANHPAESEAREWSETLE